MVAELAEAIDNLSDADPASLADRETIQALHRQLERLEAVTTRASAAFEARGDWEADGAHTAASWIATRCHQPVVSAKRRVSLGRALRHMPGAEAAWLAGDIGAPQVAALAKARTPATEEAFARSEDMLVDYAAKLRFGSFVRVVAYWRYRADPYGSEQQAEAEREGRGVWLSQSFQGTWLGKHTLDPVAGAIVHNELKRLEAELLEDDWKQARARVGEQATVADLCRTPAQRRADALVEMAIRSRTTPAGGRRPEPLFSVFCDYQTFADMLCELADGTVVTPGSLSPFLEQGWVERVVFDGPSRVIDVGVRRRIFSGATRRAIQLRDRECFHAYCEEPAADAQIDHIQPWAEGGLTTQDNGRVACGFHNRDRHRRPEPPLP